MTHVERLVDLRERPVVVPEVAALPELTELFAVEHAAVLRLKLVVHHLTVIHEAVLGECVLISQARL